MPVTRLVTVIESLTLPERAVQVPLNVTEANTSFQVTVPESQAATRSSHEAPVDVFKAAPELIILAWQLPAR
jgi:hypothetical protein